MAEVDLYDIYDTNPLRARVRLSSLDVDTHAPKETKVGVLMRKTRRNWVKYWCKLVPTAKKLQFYNSEDAAMAFQLELAGARARRLILLQESEETNYVFEIFTPRFERTLEILSCTSIRDLQQWLDSLGEILMVTVPRSPRAHASTFSFRAFRESIANWRLKTVSMRRFQHRASTSGPSGGTYAQRFSMTEAQPHQKARDTRASIGDFRPNSVRSLSKEATEEIEFWSGEKAMLHAQRCSMIEIEDTKTESLHDVGDGDTVSSWTADTPTVANADGSDNLLCRELSAKDGNLTGNDNETKLEEEEVTLTTEQHDETAATLPKEATSDVLAACNKIDIADDVSQPAWGGESTNIETEKVHQLNEEVAKEADIIEPSLLPPHQQDSNDGGLTNEACESDKVDTVQPASIETEQAHQLSEEVAKADENIEQLTSKDDELADERGQLSNNITHPVELSADVGRTADDASALTEPIEPIVIAVVHLPSFPLDDQADDDCVALDERLSLVVTESDADGTRPSCASSLSKVDEDDGRASKGELFLERFQPAENMVDEELLRTLPALDECKAHLKAAMERVLNGDEHAQPDVDHWEAVLSSHPLYIMERQATEEAWDLEQKTHLEAALRRMRELVPPDVSVSSVQTMKTEGLPHECACRIFQTKALWLIRMQQIDMVKIHTSDLFSKYPCQGLDIKELRAVYAVLPRFFINDNDGKRTEWLLTFKQRLYDLTAKEEEGNLTQLEKRNEAYRTCKKIKLYDHHTLYTQMVVKSGVGQTYQPYDYKDAIEEVENTSF